MILTREIAVWRVNPESRRLSPWLLLGLVSLGVVHDQFRYLVLMQMNREDLGSRYRELLLPIPRDATMRAAWSDPIKEYFEATSRVRASYDMLANALSPDLFVDRP